MLQYLTRVFGSRSERIARGYRSQAVQAGKFEKDIQSLSDEALAAKTVEFRERLASGTKLDALAAEAFAVVRETARRTLGMRHFDVQFIGGLTLHDGKIAEMRTGEGKTLMSTLPAYLNALTGEGVHLVTVNEYLASRDAEWMSPVYQFLGLTVGVIRNGQTSEEKRAAYACDITYGTNNEFGFDYLRDNMALSKEQRYQRGLNYAIIDEVDSILIDEARTPLIISGPADETPDLYIKVNRIVPEFTRQADEQSEGDFWVDEKGKQVHLSEAGQELAESLLRKAGILGEDDGDEDDYDEEDDLDFDDDDEEDEIDDLDEDEDDEDDLFDDDDEDDEDDEDLDEDDDLATDLDEDLFDDSDD